MSDAALDEQPDSSPRPTTPAELRRLHRKREVAETARRRREAVLRRIVGGGVTARRITESLQRDLGNEWTRAGVEQVLHDLASLDEAHQVDGRWSVGPAPQGEQVEADVETTTPAVDPRDLVLRALGERTMARMSLAAASGLDLAAGLQVIARLIEEDVLEPEIAGRVRLRRQPAVPDGVTAPAVRADWSRGATVGSPPSGPDEDRAVSPDQEGPVTVATGGGVAVAPSDYDCDDTDTDTDTEAETPAPSASDEDCDYGRTEREPSQRALVLAAVQARPGLTSWELCRRTGIPRTTVLAACHGLRLVKVPLTREEQPSGRPAYRWYPPGYQVPAVPPPPDPEPETTAARVLALVTAEPGLSTQEIAQRLGLVSKSAASALQRGPFRRERHRNPEAAGGRGNTIARWFIDGPAPGPRGRRADGSPLRDQLVALVHAHPGITLRAAAEMLPEERSKKTISTAFRTAVRMELVRAEGHTTLRRYYPPEGGRGEPLIPDPSPTDPALARVDAPVVGPVSHAPGGAAGQHVTATRAAPVPTDPDGSGDLVLDAWRERCLAAEARARAAEDRAAEPDPLADLALLTGGTANQRHIEAALRLAYRLGRASR